MTRLARLINQTFADYFLTVWLDEHQFERMCYEEDVDLAKSVVAMVNDVPVGISLFSSPGQQGWISGVGVLPLWRRRGVAITHPAAHPGCSPKRKTCHPAPGGFSAECGRHCLCTGNWDFQWERDLLVLTLERGRFSHVTASGHRPGRSRVPYSKPIPGFTV